MRYLVIPCALFLVSGRAALAATPGAVHEDPVAPILLALLVILLVAKVGGELFERLGQSAVLGELVGGVILGNMVVLFPGWTLFEPLRVFPLQEHWAIVIDGLARLGVIILLFEVGLESTVQSMMKVGATSLRVAALGVVAPFVLGFAVSWFFITELPAQAVGLSLIHVHIFVGAVLCATSVGITARVFKDLGRLQTQEAQIILGASVIDDILGLVILALVSDVIMTAESGQSLSLVAVFRIILVAALFLGLSVAFGILLVPKIMRQLSRFRTSGVMLISALLLAFGMSYLASAAGLAAIVGAFAAGLLLEDVHFAGFREDIRLARLLQPVSTFLVPFFFVLMGIQVRLETFISPTVLGLAAALTVAAVAGKQVCGLGVFRRGLDRLSIGLGMIPRGEVGLIFASIGKELGVVDGAVFSAIVMMVMITTLITPPLLNLTLARRKDARPARP